MNKIIEVYANVNPLRTNEFICVENSSSFAMSPVSYIDKVLPDTLTFLQSKGFNCYYVVKITSVVNP